MLCFPFSHLLKASLPLKMSEHTTGGHIRIISICWTKIFKQEIIKNHDVQRFTTHYQKYIVLLFKNRKSECLSFIYLYIKGDFGSLVLLLISKIRQEEPLFSSFKKTFLLDLILQGPISTNYSRGAFLKLA